MNDIVMRGAAALLLVQALSLGAAWGKPNSEGKPATASCEDEIGREKAATLATQCRTVSPATRPPCNPKNDCAMIRDEIRRSCRMLADGKDAKPPSFCKEYLAH
jgi:hypothetical protein